MKWNPDRRRAFYGRSENQRSPASLFLKATCVYAQSAISCPGDRRKICCEKTGLGIIERGKLIRCFSTCTVRRTVIKALVIKLRARTSEWVGPTWISTLTAWGVLWGVMWVALAWKKTKLLQNESLREKMLSKWSRKQGNNKMFQWLDWRQQGHLTHVPSMFVGIGPWAESLQFLSTFYFPQLKGWQ